MTLPEKAGQMMLAWQGETSTEDVRRYALGGVFSGGDSAAGAKGYDHKGDTHPEPWAKMVDEFHEVGRQTRLGIPVIYGFDAVHGERQGERR